MTERNRIICFDSCQFVRTLCCSNGLDGNGCNAPSVSVSGRFLAIPAAAIKTGNAMKFEEVQHD